MTYISSFMSFFFFFLIISFAASLRIPGRSVCTIKRILQSKASPTFCNSRSTVQNYERRKDAVPKWPSLAALIAGTTIGGGFLALPRATAPCGALPSTFGLFGCWTFLLGTALALAEAAISTRRLQEMDGQSTSISVFKIAEQAFDVNTARIVGAVFCILLLSTLVAQLNKSGVLLQEIIPLGSRVLLTLTFSAIMSAISFGGGPRLAEGFNSVLTVGMLGSFCILACAGAQLCQSKHFRFSNWSLLLPGALWRRFASGSANLLSVPQTANTSQFWAIPVFLQLLVYAETVPVVCSRLQGNRSAVVNAISYGSVVPLFMCIIWNLVALGIVSPHALLASGGTGVLNDPVAVLLSLQKQSSRAGSAGITGTGIDLGRLVSASVLSLAFCAISTTVIGSLLTAKQFVEDVFVSSATGPGPGHDMPPVATSQTSTDTDTDTSIPASATSIGRASSIHSLSAKDMEATGNRGIRMDGSRSGGGGGGSSRSRNISNLLHTGLAICPAAFIAAFGGESLYFVATAFAGAFPVTFLWGLFPPLAALRLRKKLWEKGLTVEKLLPAPLAYFLAGMSAVALLLNIILGIS